MDDTVHIPVTGGAVEQLHIITCEEFARVYNALLTSGFHTVRFEHKQRWEMKGNM